MEHVWAAHCSNESGLLDQYAAAMHRLAADIWPLNNAETRIEWCYMACMNYFFGGGLKRIRDKAERRRNCCHHEAEAGDKLKVMNDIISLGIWSFNSAEPVNAAAAIESIKSHPVASSFTV